MSKGIRSIVSHNHDTAMASAELVAQLEGLEPNVIVFFASHHHDGAAIARSLRDRFGGAQVIGCTTAGEFTERANLSGGVTGLALTREKVRRCAARLVRYADGGVEQSVRKAATEIASEIGVEDLRSADPSRYVGIVLMDGLSGREEEVNEILGNLAPMISFVGGSAGDALEFQSTRVFANGEEATEGAVLLLIDAAVPFTVGKTCSFAPTEHAFRVTRADVKNRTVYELDGKPVLEVYAKALRTTPDKLTGDVFMSHPVGLVIDGEPWIRSPQRVLPDGGLKFYCNIAQGMKIRLMNSTDLVLDAHDAMKNARKALGAPVSGGLAFNCVLRRLEMDAKKLHEDFLESFEGMQVGGFHTYGETWLGHINQTLTALWFA
jgi:hypothetical protein